MADNEIKLIVKVDDHGAITSMRRLDEEAKASANRQSGIWSKMSSSIGTAFTGLGATVAGALGVGLTTPLAAAGLSLGAFAAVALPSLEKVKKALTSTGAAGQKAWAKLSPAQRDLAHDVQGLQHQFDGLQRKMAPVVAQVADMAVKIGGKLMPALGAFAGAGAKVITGFLTPFSRLLSSDVFAKFTDSVAKLAAQMGPLVGNLLVSLIKTLMQLVTQAGPGAIKIFRSLLPVIADITNGLVPFIAMVTNAVGAFLVWVDKYPALKVAIIGIGIAIGIAVAAASDGILPLIGLFAALIGGIIHLWQTSQKFRDIVTGAFSHVADGVLRAAHILLDIWHVMADAALQTASDILHAFALIPGPQQHYFQTAAKAVDGFKRNVDTAFNAAIAKIDQWRHTVDNLPKVIKIQGDINDLTAKLNSAKKQLADPNLNKTRRIALEAETADAMRRIAALRLALEAIQSKTVYVTTIPVGGGNRIRAAGGLIGAAASGGLRSNMTMVGEHGRELVSLPPGSRVHSNPDTERMLARSGGGGHITVEFVRSSSMTGLDDLFWTWLQHGVRVKGGNPAMFARKVAFS